MTSTAETGQGADEPGERLNVGFTKLIGLEITAASKDEVRGELEVRPELFQPFGLLHGGVHCTIVETLASIGAAFWLGDEGSVVGVANSTDFLRSATGGLLRGVATPVHRGRSQQLWAVVIIDADDRMVAKGQVRLQNLRTSERAPKA